MPLVRFQVRNEYGMGDPELYRPAVKREEPKPVLDGVAVAGLVGILRQLGDMAEFAADIFHDLHEEVIATSARGRRVLTRVRNIEAALPSIEKAVKGQTSHIHLAYVPGIDFHAHVRIERSHLLSTDLPRFMMDSYEECRDPPRLYLLDKFDSGGSGVCLKRYSDPTFFHKAWDMLSKVQKAENAQRDKKYNKIKRNHGRNNGAMQHSSPMSHIRNGSDLLISSQRSSRFRSASIDLESISDNKSVPSRSTSFGSKSRFSQIDHVSNSDPNPNRNPDEISRLSSSSPSSSVRKEETNRESTNVRQLNWKEKENADVEPTRSIYCDDVIMDKVRNLDPGLKPVIISPGNLNLGLSLVSEESEVENFADALNTLESETEMETEYCNKLELSEKTDFDSKMIVSSNGEMHESSENSQIAPLEKLSLNDSQRFNNGNGLNETQSNLDTRSIESGNQITSKRQQSPEISQIAPIESTNNFEANEINSDLDDESFCETSPRVRIKPKNASSLYELEFPQFSEITPMVSPAHHPGSQKNIENTVIDEPSRTSIVESINSDFDAKINAENNNNAPYIIDEHKPDKTKDHFVNVPTKLWTNAGLFGLEPSKPNVSTPNGVLNHENGVSSHENESNHTVAATHNNNNLSSSFSSLAQRFLTSSLQKGISQTPLSNTNNTLNTDLNFTKSIEPKLTKSSDNSSHISGQSSPPLEFMKIFIHPSNGDLNSNSNYNSEDQNSIFPDIQILHESEYQNGSDSDEDTFCKSYVYSSSDEQLSPVIHSNSDLWDQEQIPTESFENIPSSHYMGFEQMNLPGIESVVFSSPSNNQNENNECFNNQESLVENELMPPPPPLPPAQWRVVNKPPVPLPPSFPTTFVQPKFSKINEKSEKNGEAKGANAGKEVSLETEVLQWHNNKMEQQKLNGLDKPKKETIDAKDLDEREDLLDQIRKKSFNLRRTMTSKPNPDSSQTATNSSVSAILEKANAIRQAFVGSDDGGEDDGWSDV
ncbi:hypothetical protein LUZ60_009363 [Juncus effusus]|nr:hypothetical protein LUZ60_009363 [Juncus effusus]